MDPIPINQLTRPTRVQEDPEATHFLIMMKLILSLTLIWTLSSTAEALQCWQISGNVTELHPCKSTELCATSAQQVFDLTPNKDWRSIQFLSRLCLPSSHLSEGNHTVSLNVGVLNVTTSVHVCNTDGCNSEDIPYLGVQEKNSLKCFTCDDPFSPVCNKTVECVGVQDRCINGTAVDGRNKNATLHIFGCVSANICEDTRRLEFFMKIKFLRKPKYCERNLCNSAWSVKLSVMSLLLGLFTLTFY
ncbi:uncharacterized protein LOC133985264 [Scomber scombrus]|uniref:uncharacterized protein LOC133985264 n=1 Tax=Scomber scombrus TaxID=13677 RepID=UPI002DDA6607|nr:uncharacterized protein LOC133985264 [Scomber scombrus]